MNILETERLIIRHLQLDDAELIFSYSQEECTKKELPDEHFETMEDAIEALEFIINQYDKGYPLVYALDLKESNYLIGHVSLSFIPDGNEIGYAIATAYQGNGLATELVKAFSPWAKDVFNLDMIYGVTKEENAASWKVLEKCGYQLQKEEIRKSFGGQYSVKIYTF